ncbi:hypothetical protein C1645_755000, partial [Glomus cerebriforme]
MTFEKLSSIKPVIFLVFVTIFTIFTLLLRNFDLNKHIFLRIQSIVVDDGSQPTNLRLDFFQKRNKPFPREKSATKGPGVTVAQQDATSQKLEQGMHKHYEEESEYWWEVYRLYEYETSDNLGDLFRVKVDEAQSINKRHAELQDLLQAGVKTQDTGSQEIFNVGIGIQQGQTNYNANTIAAAGTDHHQIDDLVDVKQYQRIHVIQYTLGGILINEYEEERLAEYQYQLEIDVFNQWEHASEHESNQSDDLALGF